MNERANFYVLLGLDPTVQDATVIEKAIAQKRRDWSKQSGEGPPATRRRAKLYLDQIGDIERVMRDAEARRAEAADARRVMQKERAAQFARLDPAIAVLRARGSVSPADVARLVKELGGAIAEQEVLDRLRASGLSVDEEPLSPAAGRTGVPRLDPVRMASLRPNLALLGIKNLYELLELSPRSSRTELYARATALNAELLRVPRLDAESSARKELAGHCKAIFASDEERQRYDNALSLEPMEDLRVSIELAGSSKFLSISVQDELVRQAREQGVNADDAHAFLAEVARNRGWQLQRAEKLPSDELRQCGHCNALARSATDRLCARCGEPLVVECPRCGRATPSTDAVCQCGCQVGDAPLVKGFVGEGRRCSAEGDFSAALAALDRALLLWPDWGPAVTARKEVLVRREARETALHEVDGLVRARRFFAARAALERLRRGCGAVGTEDVERGIAAELRQAEALEREADTLRDAGKVEEALERYERALELCTDLSRARDAIGSHPPGPPPELRATVLGTGFHLTWPPSPSRGKLRYLVLRADGGAPRHDGEGTVIGELGGLQVDDVEAPVGTPVWYAVFTVRAQVRSHQSAVCGPLLLTAEVGRPEVMVADGEVTLRWSRPSGCIRTEVWRGLATPPQRRGEGELVDSADDGAHDVCVRNGGRYGYRVVAVYRDPVRPGAEQFTAGVVLTATPAPPPAAVLDLRARRSGLSVTLAWTPVPGAGVQIRRAAYPPDVSPGSVVPVTAAEQFGSLLEVHGSGSAEWRIEAQGQVAFVPLTVAGTVAVVGQAVVLTTIDDVGNPVVKTNGRDIVLTWDWPTGVDEVRVCHTHDHYPVAPDELGAVSTRVTRAAYERASGFELRVPKPEPHFFSLFARAPTEELYSAGVRILEPMGQGKTVRYCVGLKKGGFLSRFVVAAWIDLECDDAIPSLPALIVLGKTGRQPLWPGDGTLLAEVAGLRFADGRARIDIPTHRANASTYVKMFFKDGRHAQGIRLMPASGDRLRLG